MFSAYCPDLLLGQCLTDVARTPDFIVRWTFSGRTSPYILQTYCGFRVTHEGETILTQRMLYTRTDFDEPLTDANRRSWGADHERAKRIAVANDLKDLAADEKVWMVVTYQSTIEDREWLNDERNVLTEYNCSEAKGLARPCTHLISLNQSSAERKENVMRLHIAKSRFFKKGDTIKIATDYDNEVFYDGPRTLNLNRE